MANIGFMQIRGPYIYDSVNPTWLIKDGQVVGESSSDGGCPTKIGIQGIPNHKYTIRVDDSAETIITLGRSGLFELSGTKIQDFRPNQDEGSKFIIDLYYEVTQDKINQNRTRVQKGDMEWQAIQQQIQ